VGDGGHQNFELWSSAHDSYQLDGVHVVTLPVEVGGGWEATDRCTLLRVRCSLLRIGTLTCCVGSCIHAFVPLIAGRILWNWQDSGGGGGELWHLLAYENGTSSSPETSSHCVGLDPAMRKALLPLPPTQALHFPHPPPPHTHIPHTPCWLVQIPTSISYLGHQAYAVLVNATYLAPGTGLHSGSLQTPHSGHRSLLKRTVRSADGRVGCTPSQRRPFAVCPRVSKVSMSPFAWNFRLLHIWALRSPKQDCTKA